MNKSKSYPTIHENKELNLKKSISFDILKLDEFYFEEFFEGDGELGIIFAEYKDNIIVKNILPNTVAAETYGLYKSMMLIDIDNQEIHGKSLETINKIVRKKWLRNNRIYLKFQKPIHKEIYTLLLNNNLVKYYDEFIELGTHSNEDFKFVEYEDLVKMNMNRKEKDLFRNINPNI